MAARTTLSSADRAFFEGVGRAVFMNPFSGEREQLLGRIAPGHAGEALRLDPRLYAFVAEVEQRLSRLDRRGTCTIARLGDADRELMAPVFLYEVYHRFVPELDALVETQVRMSDTVAPAPFAAGLLGHLARRGFSDPQCSHYLAMFYMLRRAFFFTLKTLVGDCPSMQGLRRALWNTVFTHDMRTYDRYLWNRMEDFSTLVLGETGTGKGSVAAVIGRSGLIPFDPKKGRFASGFSRSLVAINLSQFPEGLLESELFGHKKGAYTGAINDHAGMFEICSEHGTLFLDEIGEVGIPTQIKLLQVLQERTFTPLGSHEQKRFAGRVIGATNRPLDELRRGGRFRDDLYYRLCSNVVVVPTLRQRIEESSAELPQLVRAVVARTTGEESDELSSVILDAFERDLPKGYPWPGNVRELEQGVRRVLLCGRYGGEAANRGATSEETLMQGVRAGSLDARELTAHYCSMLHERLGSFEEVARRTGLDRRTVSKHVRKGGGTPPSKQQPANDANANTRHTGPSR